MKVDNYLNGLEIMHYLINITYLNYLCTWILNTVKIITVGNNRAFEPLHEKC